MKKLNTQDFIKRAQEIHGNEYDYSETVYTKLHAKLTIICRIHGPFEQFAGNHINGGRGCKICGNIKKQITIEEFIHQAHEVHNNLYDYSLTKLDGMDNKVEIICSDHGSFYQRATDHIKGFGCDACSGTQKLTTEEFIVKSKQVHNNKYTYELVTYTGSKSKVDITCLKHGVFKQTANDHLTGYGCPFCGGTQKVNTDDFIVRSNQAHNGKYQYTKTNIQGMNTNVIITCPIHGHFDQRPADHVNGVGCPTCAKAELGGYCELFFSNNPDAKILPAFLYLVLINDKFCKIGITRRPIKNRLAGLSYETVKTISTTLYDAYLTEQKILEFHHYERFKIKDLQDTWQTGWTECFPKSLLPTLINEMEQLQCQQF